MPDYNVLRPRFGNLQLFYFHFFAVLLQNRNSRILRKCLKGCRNKNQYRKYNFLHRFDIQVEMLCEQYLNLKNSIYFFNTKLQQDKGKDVLVFIYFLEFKTYEYP